ncbi:phosphotransferase [Martelella endophytica]|uniref:Aminoglycoside phosphotransferase n=1 Tax=Martelella endophytica TaxID=1486262 RepID=A0A0D5LJZ8_MAREN|nr:phosphotransferase [Martelella endophytica]AJY44514.1 aminoglycoside phosphotransferase [Martelella endophytica]
MHADAVPIDLARARRLIEDQFPEFSGLPLTPLEAGTDHAIFRIGETAAARFPRRAADPDVLHQKLEQEAAALAELAAYAPVPTPEPLGLGRPGADYPLPWSVQTFLPGETATPTGLAHSEAFAGDLARLIATLRNVDTAGRSFDGVNRGGRLTDHDGWVATCLANSEGLLDVTRLRALWEGLRTLPAVGPDVMSHRDLIPANLLVREDRLAGLLDGGAFGPADRSLDLVAGWHLLDAPRRAQFRQALAPPETEWLRGAAWAFEQAIGLVWYYEKSHPGMHALGRSTLARLLDDPEISSYGR